MKLYSTWTHDTLAAVRQLGVFTFSRCMIINPLFYVWQSIFLINNLLSLILMGTQLSSRSFKELIVKILLLLDDSRPIFTSQAMLDADKEIHGLCPDESDLEVISVSLLIYSDSTHLASFRTASCWPVYLFFGSQSKYIWEMPTSVACHHITYMPSVHNIRTFVFSSNTLSITEQHPRFLPGALQHNCNHCHSYTLQEGAYTCHILADPQWHIFWCPLQWNCSWMWGWSSSQTISSHSNVLGQLSRKVSSLYLVCIDQH